MSGEIAEIEYTDSSFNVHEFTHTFLNHNLKFEILKMNNTTVIWVGDLRDPQLTDLSLAIKSSDSVIPLVTKIIGTASADITSNGLAQRLNKKLKKSVYVSFNVPILNNTLLEAVEGRLNEEIDLNSDMF